MSVDFNFITLAHYQLLIAEIKDIPNNQVKKNIYTMTTHPNHLMRLNKAQTQTKNYPEKMRHRENIK